MSEQGNWSSEKTVREESATAAGPHGSDPQLIAVCGLPGVGKSTVASTITERIGGQRLRTDAVRKELFGEPDYSTGETERVYRELSQRAKTALRDGKSVILDATFADTAYRDRIREVARDCDVSLQFVRVTCEQGVVERRIEAREDISDADIEIHRQFRGSFDPFETEPVVIDNSGSEAETHQQIDELF